MPRCRPTPTPTDFSCSVRADTSIANKCVGAVCAAPSTYASEGWPVGDRPRTANARDRDGEMRNHGRLETQTNEPIGPACVLQYLLTAHLAAVALQEPFATTHVHLVDAIGGWFAVDISILDARDSQ